MADGRDKSGRWLGGRSPNPGGRPKGYREVVELCRAETVANVRTLIEIRDNPESADATRALCANSLLDRGWGKAVQPIDLDPDNHPVTEKTDAELLEIIAAAEAARKDKTV